MKFFQSTALAIGLLTYPSASASESESYIPSDEILQSRQEFAESRFGIFIHWGIYSMFGQGEWYLNYGVNAKEYAKAANGFYPASFDASKWVDAIKDSGAKYICFTSRHHDGFSMWHTSESKYNIVDATPFKRDIIKELADECHSKDIRLHLYYSHIDWTRPDYPSGRTGLETGRDTTLRNWSSYYRFMNSQLTELLTRYGKIGAIWFDGWWDHDCDSVPFDWELPEQYRLIHDLQPACLIGNNHHQSPFPGEDIQIFERDIPGENSAGLSGQEVSQLPLETCQTMNGMWGYKVKDQNYKSTRTLIQYLVKTAGMGANLLLNIGPQPDGRLPDAALNRLKEIGEWMRDNGETIYGTSASEFEAQPWGTSTTKGDTIYLHILDPQQREIFVPLNNRYITSAVRFSDKSPVEFNKSGTGYKIVLPTIDKDEIDCILELHSEIK